MSRHEFAHYVERVFRFHNQVVNELIEASYAVDGGNEDKKNRLSTAEARMMEVCRPLNETVSANMAGGDAGIGVQWQLADSVPECEKASEVVEALIR